MANNSAKILLSLELDNQKFTTSIKESTNILENFSKNIKLALSTNIDSSGIKSLMGDVRSGINEQSSLSKKANDEDKAQKRVNAEYEREFKKLIIEEEKSAKKRANAEYESAFKKLVEEEKKAIADKASADKKNTQEQLSLSKKANQESAQQIENNIKQATANQKKATQDQLNESKVASKILGDIERSELEKKKEFAKKINQEVTQGFNENIKSASVNQKKATQDQLSESKVAAKILSDIEKQELEKKKDFAKKINQEVTQGFKDNIKSNTNNQKTNATQSSPNFLNSDQKSQIRDIEASTIAFRIQRAEINNQVNSLVSLKNSIKGNSIEESAHKNVIEQNIQALKNKKIAIDSEISILNQRKFAIKTGETALNDENKAMQENIKLLSSQTNALSTSRGSMTEMNQSLSTLKGSLSTFMLAIQTMVVSNPFMEFDREFEKNMRNMNSIALHSEDVFQDVKKQLIDIGKVNQYGNLRDLSGALYQAYSSGYVLADSLKLVKESDLGALSGLADTKEQLESTVSVLHAYSMGVDQAAHINDIFLKTVQAGVITMPQLNHIIGQAVTLAPDLGLSLENVTASLIALTRVGLNHNSSLTVMNALMTGFLKPSHEASEYAKELGINLSASAFQGTNFAAVIKDLIQKTGNNPDIISKLFGNQRELKAFFKLSKDGGDTFLKYYEDQVNKSADAVKNSSEEQRKTFDQSLQRLKDTFEITMQEVGELSSTLMKPVIWVADGALKLFNDLPEPIRKTVAVLAIFTTLITGGVIAFASLSIAIASVIALLDLLATKSIIARMAIATLTTSFGFLGMAIAALAGPLLIFEAIHYAADLTNNKLLQSIDLFGKIKHGLEYEGDLKNQKDAERSNQEDKSNALSTISKLEKKKKLSLDDKKDLAKAYAVASNQFLTDDKKMQPNSGELQNLLNITNKEYSEKKKLLMEDIKNTKEVVDKKTKVEKDAVDKKIEQAKQYAQHSADYDKLIYESSHTERQNKLKEADVKFQDAKETITGAIEGKTTSKTEKEHAKEQLKALEKAYRDDLAKINIEYDEKEKSSQDAKNTKYVKSINDKYDAQIKLEEIKLNQIEELADKKDFTLQEKLKRMKPIFEQLAKIEGQRSAKFQAGSKERISAKEKQSSYTKKIEDNEDKIQKANTKDDINKFDRGFEDRKKLLSKNAQINKDSEDTILNNEIANNKTRINEIHNFTKAHQLTKEQRVKYDEELKALENQIDLDRDKRKEQSFQRDIERQNKSIDQELNHTKSLVSIGLKSTQDEYNAEIEANNKKIALEKLKLSRTKNKDKKTDITNQIENLKDSNLVVNSQKEKDIIDRRIFDKETEFTKEANNLDLLLKKREITEANYRDEILKTKQAKLDFYKKELEIFESNLKAKGVKDSDIKNLPEYKQKSNDITTYSNDIASTTLTNDRTNIDVNKQNRDKIFSDEMADLQRKLSARKTYEEKFYNDSTAKNKDHLAILEKQKQDMEDKNKGKDKEVWNESDKKEYDALVDNIKSTNQTILENDNQLKDLLRKNEQDLLDFRTNIYKQASDEILKISETLSNSSNKTLASIGAILNSTANLGANINNGSGVIGALQNKRNNALDDLRQQTGDTTSSNKDLLNKNSNNPLSQQASQNNAIEAMEGAKMAIGELTKSMEAYSQYSVKFDSATRKSSQALEIFGANSKEVANANKEVVESFSDYLKALPGIGDLLSKVMRGVTDFFGATISEKDKKDIKDVEDAAFNLSQTRLKLGSQTADKQIQYAQNEHDQSVKLLIQQGLKDQAYADAKEKLELELSDKLIKIRQDAVDKALDIEQKLSVASKGFSSGSYENKKEQLRQNMLSGYRKLAKEYNPNDVEGYIPSEDHLNEQSFVYQTFLNETDNLETEHYKLRIQLGYDQKKAELESQAESSDQKRALLQNELEFQDTTLRASRDAEILNEEEFQSKKAKLVAEFDLKTRQLEFSISKETIETQSDIQKSKIDLWEDNSKKTIALAVNEFNKQKSILDEQLKYTLISNQKYQTELDKITLNKNKSILELNKNSYNTQLNILKETLEHEAELLESKYDSNLQTIKDYNKKVEDLKRDRKDDDELIKKKKDLFTQDVTRIKPTLQSAYFRDNIQQHENNSKDSEKKIIDDRQFNGVSLEDTNKKLRDEYAKEAIYYQTLLEGKYLNSSQAKRTELDDKRTAAMQKYYSVALDEEAEKLDREKRNAVKENEILETKIKDARAKFNQAKLDLDKIFKDSSDNFTTNLISSIDILTKYAEKPLAQLGTKLFNEIQNAIKEANKTKDAVKQFDNGVITSPSVNSPVNSPIIPKNPTTTNSGNNSNNNIGNGSGIPKSVTIPTPVGNIEVPLTNGNANNNNNNSVKDKSNLQSSNRDVIIPATSGVIFGEGFTEDQGQQERKQKILNEIWKEQGASQYEKQRTKSLDEVIEFAKKYNLPTFGSGGVTPSLGLVAEKGEAEIVLTANNAKFVGSKLAMYEQLCKEYERYMKPMYVPNFTPSNAASSYVVNNNNTMSPSINISAGDININGAGQSLQQIQELIRYERKAGEDRIKEIIRPFLKR